MTPERKGVVITGASRGIGAQLSKAYRHIGYQVIASSRSMRTSDDPAILVIEGDITRPETAERILGMAAERFGRIDTLVNNAGVFIAKPFTEYSEKDFATMIAVNLAGFFHLSQKAAASMLRVGSGHIVNITATIAEQPVASLPAALAALTKGGLNAITGETRVSRFLGSFDCGRILNAKTASSQFRGGIVMGLGLALMEETQFDERNGRIMNPSLSEYHVPVHMDVPEIDVMWTDIPDPRSPMGACGVGEIGITGVGAAVANAVFNACGKRIRALPITLDKVMG